MIQYTGTYTDLYQITMAQVYFRQGRHQQPAVFDYFFRKLPFEGGYAVLAGVDTLIDALEQWRFDADDLHYLSEQGFPGAFVDYLKDLRFSGRIRGMPEGSLIFPGEPVMQVEAPLAEAQLIETILLNILNFQSLIATKASRMQQVAQGRSLLDFGLRRSHGPGGYYASRAAVIGGFDATSHVRAARDFGLKASGTMAHSYVQSYDDELTAFRHFAAERPQDCVLLVDTYDTLRSGLPHAITVGREMGERGEQLKGIRLDSGDLAYLAKESRRMLDEAGLPEVKIAASNQLDEYVIKSLLEQEAPIDLFGVGTRLVTGQPDAAFDGVYKLAELDGQPRIKLSENPAKTTIPQQKQVYRLYGPDGRLTGADVVCLAGEECPREMHHLHDERKHLEWTAWEGRPMLQALMEEGQRAIDALPPDDLSRHRQQQLAVLPREFQRFENPHIYKVGVSSDLKSVRDDLIQNLKNNTP